jgi:hypothetical protein
LRLNFDDNKAAAAAENKTATKHTKCNLGNVITHTIWSLFKFLFHSLRLVDRSSRGGPQKIFFLFYFILFHRIHRLPTTISRLFIFVFYKEIEDRRHEFIMSRLALLCFAFLCSCT